MQKRSMSRKRVRTKPSSKRETVLKPDYVVETHGDPDYELENPLGKLKDKTVTVNLPKDFKTADKLTKEDEYKFEIGKLRSLLSSWTEKVGDKTIIIDPLNRIIQVAERE